MQLLFYFPLSVVTLIFLWSQIDAANGKKHYFAPMQSCFISEEVVNFYARWQTHNP